MENACGLHCAKIENITVRIDKQVIIRDVTFDIHCGELTMLIGKNEALLDEIPHSGKVEFLDMKENRKKKIKIGYVPQSLNIERNMPTSVYDMYASYISDKPVWLKKDKQLYNEVKENLKRFGAEQLIDKKVGNLSGGELQRILLAIATTPIPNLLILDEPLELIEMEYEIFIKY